MTQDSSHHGCKVLQVTGTLGLGGAETMVVTAAEALRGRCSFDYLVFEDGPGALDSRAIEAGGSIIRMGTPRSLGHRKFMRELVTILEDGNYDAVHSHIKYASGRVMQAAHKAEIRRRIAHSHAGADRGRGLRHLVYKNYATRLIEKYSTAHAACTDGAGERLFGTVWSSRGGLIIPNGVDVETFSAGIGWREATRKEWGLKPDDIAVGMVARLFDMKNHSFMLDVMALDAATNGPATLFIVGDGPLRNELELKARDLHLGDRVRFLGPRQDIPQILGGLDLLAMPSKFEGLPVALVEAQAAGLPCLVADTVAQESDMGLDLITWLPLDDPDLWQKEMVARRERATPEAIRAQFAKSGFDSRASAELMLSLYTARSRTNWQPPVT